MTYSSVLLCYPQAECCSSSDACTRTYKSLQIEREHIKSLRVIISSLFSVNYDQDFYKDLLTWPIRLLISHGAKNIGALCVKREQIDENSEKLYISVFGILVFWRRRGIGSALMHIVEMYCAENPGIKQIYLHVQEDNEDAQLFYKRHGFHVVDKVENFYRRTACTTALIMEKTL